MSIQSIALNKGMGPGEEFKLAHGYSRTMSNLMKKYGVSTPEEYRQIRKANRKIRTKAKVVKTPKVKVEQKGGNNAKNRK